MSAASIIAPAGRSICGTCSSPPRSGAPCVRSPRSEHSLPRRTCRRRGPSRSKRCCPSEKCRDRAAAARPARWPPRPRRRLLPADDDLAAARRRHGGRGLRRRRHHRDAPRRHARTDRARDAAVRRVALPRVGLGRRRGRSHRCHVAHGARRDHHRRHARDAGDGLGRWLDVGEAPPVERLARAPEARCARGGVARRRRRSAARRAHVGPAARDAAHGDRVCRPLPGGTGHGRALVVRPAHLTRRDGRCRERGRGRRRVDHLPLGTRCSLVLRRGPHGRPSFPGAPMTAPAARSYPAPDPTPRIAPLTWVSVFVRTLAIQGSWNYETLLGNGVGFALEPVLRRLPGGIHTDAFKAAMTRESAYFNAHPYLACVAMGALSRADLSGVPPERIERFRTAICGPLGSVGDRLVWAGWLPLSSLVALIAFGLGARPLAVLLTFVVMYNVGHFGLRIWGLHVGWTRGLAVASALANPVLRNGPADITRAAAA